MKKTVTKTNKVIDICDFPDIDAEGDDDQNGTEDNPHKYGTDEYNKVEEEKLRKKWEKRLNDQKERHEKMDKIWQENYEKAQKHIKEDLLLEDLHCDPDKKNDKKKISCTPPSLKEKPLEKQCDVEEYKKCVKKELLDQYDDVKIKEKEKQKNKGRK